MRMIGSCLLPVLLLLAPVAGAACPPAGYDAVRMQELKSRGFAVPDGDERQRLAAARQRWPRCLTACYRC